ncbi:hypothetical protein L3V83_14015 [Thiotrichales bacterium 19X7-9]|nr:hypothetical protein [Thiotrichales bacterium 19X7-9]TNF69730.1 MAG: hypothetical protein EP298_01965 [Gammaproteobacteria bacterium]UTW42444.1 hypothetical protein KFE69_13360 [bacterium SCSIO 12844]
MEPHKVITWYDKKNTGAVGWIVIHNLINGVSGGGLFMSSSASLQEVADLAYTMSLKNSLQIPKLGGGKGGIKFDAEDPRANDVLKRFLKDNIDIIKKYWSTGGDINTNTEDIENILINNSNLKSSFDCLENMLQKNFNVKTCIDTFKKRLQKIEGPNISISHAITGFSIYTTVENIVNTISYKPKIIIQGFGKIGKAFCMYAKDKYNIIGICERDWFISNSEGINVGYLLKNSFDTKMLESLNLQQRMNNETDVDFLCRFIQCNKADIFCPCATRYSITSGVLDSLINCTFSDLKFGNAYIVAGANNIFASHDLIDRAFLSGIKVIPEWVSNSGAALLFLEALKQQQNVSNWNNYIKELVNDRISSFLFNAEYIAKKNNINIYQACTQIIQNEEVA